MNSVVRASMRGVGQRLSEDDAWSALHAKLRSMALGWAHPTPHPMPTRTHMGL
jgi:hypothetical protein